MLTFSEALRRKMGSAANRVQKLSFIGNEYPEMASRTELLPKDWLPQTMICGRSTNRLMP
jgi:hypothetical protein